MAEKRGKETAYRTTKQGAVARFLRALSGLYDQAARAATSL